MKAADLSKVWGMPDNSRLMKSQTSVRLNVRNGAKIAALCDMYPTKTKSDLINDLLHTALLELEKGFEFEPGRVVGEDHEKNRLVAEDVGLRTDFWRLTNIHLTEIEKELGNENPTLFVEEHFDLTDDQL